MKKIPLTQGEYTIVDDEDFDLVNQFKWNLLRAKSNRKYAIGSGPKKNKLVLIHRFIMPCKRNETIDHINGDALDNRKSNLRICSFADNLKNRKVNKNNKSGYKGVWLGRKQYRAEIMSDKKRYYLGSFLTAKEAALAYDMAAKKYHGEFALLNFYKKSLEL